MISLFAGAACGAMPTPRSCSGARAGAVLRRPRPTIARSAQPGPGPSRRRRTGRRGAAHRTPRRAYALRHPRPYTWCARNRSGPAPRPPGALIDAYAHDRSTLPPAPAARLPSRRSHGSSPRWLAPAGVEEEVLDRLPHWCTCPRGGQDLGVHWLDRQTRKASWRCSRPRPPTDPLPCPDQPLVHNGLRIDEAPSRDVEHLQTERGHLRCCGYCRKGGHTADPRRWPYR
ncbi:hypothetical protein HBB16_19425 [Pseudonocardia sp. MCCB 268]|nr:hypothetical protein [Pseudonocardia cytotoxica]